MKILKKLTNIKFINKCKLEYNQYGIIQINNIFNQNQLDTILKELNDIRVKNDIFRSNDKHNIYLDDVENFHKDHIGRVELESSKLVIAYDQLNHSPLINLYKSNELKHFIANILNVNAVYESADKYGAAYVNFFENNDQLSWHFDNSEFFCNIILQQADEGGEFQYVSSLKPFSSSHHDATLAQQIINDKNQKDIETINFLSNSMIIFRGKNQMHRVQTVKKGTRINAIFTYELEPNITLNDYTRKIFFGRE